MANKITSRLAEVRVSIESYKMALQAFTHDPSQQFRLLRTIGRAITKSERPGKASPTKTLYILDASFNPPSIAHFALAKSALKIGKEEQPCRLLLLFSVHNADKAPSPAAFEERLAMMTLFASDLLDSFPGKTSESGENAHPENQRSEAHNDTVVDIAITSAPYYTDKSAVIKAIPQSETHPYHPSQTHVHLLGFDTLTRFLNPKYYTNHDPPLSALEEFFETGCRLRATMRPADEADTASANFGGLDRQIQYMKNLADQTSKEGAELVKQGWDTRWASSIELVPPNEHVGVSSTRIRTAAKQGDWDTVRDLCTSSVAMWIQHRGLYAEDATGAKMS